MIGGEKRVLLRHYLEQGMSKAAIARHLRISRRTVYNWIEAGERPGRRRQGGAIPPPGATAVKVRPLQGDHPAPPGRLPGN